MLFTLAILLPAPLFRVIRDRSQDAQPALKAWVAVCREICRMPFPPPCPRIGKPA